MLDWPVAPLWETLSSFPTVHTKPACPSRCLWTWFVCSTVRCHQETWLPVSCVWGHIILTALHAGKQRQRVDDLFWVTLVKPALNLGNFPWMCGFMRVAPPSAVPCCLAYFQDKESTLAPTICIPRGRTHTGEQGQVFPLLLQPHFLTPCFLCHLTHLKLMTWLPGVLVQALTVLMDSWMCIIPSVCFQA